MTTLETGAPAPDDGSLFEAVDIFGEFHIEEGRKAYIVRTHHSDEIFLATISAGGLDRIGPAITHESLAVDVVAYLRNAALGVRLPDTVHRLALGYLGGLCRLQERKQRPEPYRSVPAWAVGAA